MTRFRLTLLASLLAASTAWVASAALPRVEKAKVELLADRTSYAAGSRAQIAAVLDFEAGWHTNSHKPTFEYLIPTSLELALPAGWAPPAVDYPQGEAKTFAFADQPLSVYDGKVVILARLAIPAATPAGNVAVGATVVYQACDHEQCLPPVTKKLSLELPVGSAGAPQHEALFAAGPTTGAPKVAPLAAHGKAGGLGWTLLFAFLGGLILNAMPCVLPVVSLKIFGLVRSAGAGRRVVAASGIATALGILVSFWGLALAAILARTAGAAVGWGIQFQNPVFVTFLLVVVELFCLNLWGVFEIPLPGSLAQAGGHSEGMAGHFTTGLFATLMATPCSAPFLGTALGFALGQSALTIAVTFTAIALGFASPYLLLAAATGRL
ncbi:MAG TPA: protein-disulfide reductase DsbD family protein [Thermoanaerobaculia bacterium]|nr:protein-disulfide reductase DsbD family protein [Thermoanaerobaculia bacterium]